jgi:hypothetical protein
VDGRHIFTDGGLLQTLVSVVQTHCDASERSTYTRTISSVHTSEDYTSLRMTIDFGALSELAHHLRVVTSVDTAGNRNFLAFLMADVAFTIYQSGPIFTDKRQETERINTLSYRIRTEFSIACATFFARSCGYEVNPTDALYDQVSLLLVMNSWEELARIFRSSLESVEECHAGFVQFFEGQFIENSKMDLSDAEQNRQLSAEGYWNLRSVADLERWRISDVIELIEAYLSPSPHPELAFRRNAVTGDEWRRLYSWINRRRERNLWRLDSGLSRRSYRLLLDPFASLLLTYFRSPKIFTFTIYARRVIEPGSLISAWVLPSYILTW